MHAWVEIDAKALRSNILFFKSILGESRVAPVLKSNAYGHGLNEIFSLLKSEHLSRIILNCIDEARRLRELGYHGDIIVVGPVLKEDLLEAARLDVQVVIGCVETLAHWLALGRKPLLHLKIDTGLSRQGMSFQELLHVSDDLKPYMTEVVGLSTHFANVEDVTKHEFAASQLQKYCHAVAVLKSHGFKLKSHAASSASSLLLPDSHFDFCRVGISIYGLWPSRLAKLSYHSQLGKQGGQQEQDLLKPVLSLRARITQIRDCQPGQYIGYGCAYRVPRSMKIGVVSIGYGEGVPRSIGQGDSFVLVSGVRAPVVGRVCMNMMTVDLSGVRSVQVGDVATIIGRSGSDIVTAEDIAGWVQTINYEVVAGISPLLKRIIVDPA